MDLSGRTVALYGRFSPGVRERLAQQIARQGGDASRDLTRRSDVLVVGALATALVDSGALPTRIAAARSRGLPVLGERPFAGALANEPAPEATLPLATALGPTQLTAADAALLAAFDLIVVQEGRCRFGDAGVIRTAAELIGHGRSRGDVVRILARARDLSPLGRHKIVLTAQGEAALQWDDGLTTLEGQGWLPLSDEAHASLDDLFEAAAISEAEGELDDAARLYDLCARSDRADAIAPYNLANIRLARGAHADAALAYQRALARDPRFLEARYNLAQALEGAGKLDAAAAELDQVLAADPTYADAVFNRAQLTMKSGDIAAAKRLWERYLTLGPPPDAAATARKAILYCTVRLAG
jgi:tetratricopeptide (TPR) repeat protein